jgi:diadenosine tetraphosphatase ApaH/serine/threonine PP2A family protein phosphatase
MRYGLISDIHANLEALEAVLAALQNEAVDQIICLGDVIGYGPNPNECVKLVQQHATICLIGNHDEASLGRVDLDLFNYMARQAIEWTTGQLSEESKEFLRTLPYTKSYGDFMIVHASPDEPRRWNYILNLEDAAHGFEAFSEPICFIGHSHTPWVIPLQPDGRMRVLHDYPLAIKDDCRYLINIGSVGQPRDRNPDAAYAILDTAPLRYILKRVPYEVAKTQKKIRTTGMLPAFLADRLATGQ